MSLQQLTALLSAQTNNVVPPSQYIYQQETFLTKPPKLVKDEAFPRRGKELVPAHFSIQHGGQEFVPLYTPAPRVTMNYGSYIYSIVDGYQ